MESVDFTQIIVDITGVVFSVAVAVITTVIRSYIKNREMATLLENAVQNALGVIQRATEKEILVDHPAIINIDPKIAPGIKYVLEHVPEAVKHFNITPEMIEEKILSRIGLKNIEANIAVNASPNPMIVKPIDPVPTNI